MYNIYKCTTTNVVTYCIRRIYELYFSCQLLQDPPPPKAHTLGTPSKSGSGVKGLHKKTRDARQGQILRFRTEDLGRHKGVRNRIEQTN